MVDDLYRRKDERDSVHGNERRSYREIYEAHGREDYRDHHHAGSDPSGRGKYSRSSEEARYSAFSSSASVGFIQSSVWPTEDDGGRLDSSVDKSAASKGIGGAKDPRKN